MNAQYFYRVPGGKVSGPLPLESIRTAVKVSRLPAETLVSETQGEPWLDLELLPPGVAQRRREVFADYNPNLRDCPACRKQIARSATKCVHCGKDFSSLPRMILLVILTIILCGLFGFLDFLPLLFK